MIYKKFKDIELSWLGYGCMRLPQTEKNGPIDEQKAMDLIDHAYKNGVNLFDTAFFYHSGQSQTFLAKALSRYPRDSWYLSTKLPGNLMKRVEGGFEVQGLGNMQPTVVKDFAEIFEGQLRNCGVDYIDLYMLHNVAEASYDLYTDEELGIVDYLLEQKKLGRIKHLGFSTHGRPDTVEKFLNWRKGCFEFCLLQINYLDWHIQDAERKYEILTKHGVPILAMEPVRGGRLVNPGEEAVKILKQHAPDATPASWAFRYLQGFDNISVVVSGMTTLEQLEENLALFSKNNPLNKAESETLQKAVASMADLVPCTACKYCVDVCPASLDIPALLTLHNENTFDSSWTVAAAIRSMKDEQKPGACVGCGACNPLCPQNIDIPLELGKFAEALKPKE